MMMFLFFIFFTEIQWLLSAGVLLSRKDVRIFQNGQ